MTVEHKVAFYSNTPDGTHCFQAAIRMVMKYFEPEKDFTWQKLDQLSAKVEGLWTWPSAAYLWMNDHGYELHDVESFDYERLIKEGGDYLIDEYGETVGQIQIAHSDMSQEQHLAAEFLKKVTIEKREPESTEIEGFLRRGYLVICNVNSRALNEREGFSGHFVVVTGCDRESFKLHDPGLPPHEDRVVVKQLFERAWAYPNPKAKNFTAIRLSKKVSQET